MSQSTACCPLLVGFSLHLLYNPDNESSMLLRNVSGHLLHYILFTGSCHLNLLVVYLAHISTLKMEAVPSSEMSVDFYQTTWFHIQKVPIKNYSPCFLQGNPE
jgi:hypothetical protein